MQHLNEEPIEIKYIPAELTLLEPGKTFYTYIGKVRTTGSNEPGEMLDAFDLAFALPGGVGGRVRLSRDNFEAWQRMIAEIK